MVRVHSLAFCVLCASGLRKHSGFRVDGFRVKYQKDDDGMSKIESRKADITTQEASHSTVTFPDDEHLQDDGVSAMLGAEKEIAIEPKELHNHVTELQLAGAAHAQPHHRNAWSLVDLSSHVRSRLRQSSHKGLMLAGAFLIGALAIGAVAWFEFGDDSEADEHPREARRCARPARRTESNSGAAGEPLQGGTGATTDSVGVESEGCGQKNELGSSHKVGGETVASDEQTCPRNPSGGLMARLASLSRFQSPFTLAMEAGLIVQVGAETEASEEQTLPPNPSGDLSVPKAGIRHSMTTGSESFLCVEHKLSTGTEFSTYGSPAPDNQYGYGLPPQSDTIRCLLEEAEEDENEAAMEGAASTAGQAENADTGASSSQTHAPEADKKLESATLKSAGDDSIMPKAQQEKDALISSDRAGAASPAAAAEKHQPIDGHGTRSEPKKRSVAGSKELQQSSDLIAGSDAKPSSEQPSAGQSESTGQPKVKLSELAAATKKHDITTKSEPVRKLQGQSEAPEVRRRSQTEAPGSTGNPFGSFNAQDPFSSFTENDYSCNRGVPDAAEDGYEPTNSALANKKKKKGWFR